VELTNAEQTWHLMGNQAINAYVHEMISNAKKKLTLVLPDLNDIPLKDITSKRVQLQIITDLQNGTDVEWFQKLKDKGSEVLDYREKDLIAVVRDDEELLFAPVTPDDEYTTAFLSEKPEFVKIVLSMITDHWQKSAQAI
jgi:sugar-specific transcriptional regulator TrmB